MTLRRYANDLTINDGLMLQTNESIALIREGIESGAIPYQLLTLKEGDRLDALASRFYGDGSLWWIIAAASGIGWWLQIPPGTVLVVPSDLETFVSRFG
jgi:hypothetical protein